jgi:hypothetical protein
MLKKIWQSFVRWFRKLFGTGKNRASLHSKGMATERLSSAALPPLDDTDREYLFMQLLEGVAHGWQQPRAVGFFNKIRQRVRKSEWLEWLDKFGQNLIAAPVPNYELAGRMVQLGQLDCGEIGDLAGDYGAQLLNRQAEEFNAGMLPIMEFSALESGLDEYAPFDLSYSSTSIDDQFGDIPPELLLTPPPPQSLDLHSEPSAANETREITLEEFSAMLYQDPALVSELAGQFGIDTTDPQIVFNAVVAQMQQQVQQISGDLQQSGELNPPITPPEVPVAPPEVPATPPTAPPEVPATPPLAPPEVPATPPTAPPEVPTTPPIAPPEVPATPPTAPPEIPTPPPVAPPEVPATPPIAPPMPPVATSPTPIHPIEPETRDQPAPPPPPPLPKLEYKPEDPWSNNLAEHHEETHPKTANLSDRRGV